MARFAKVHNLVGKDLDIERLVSEAKNYLQDVDKQIAREQQISSGVDLVEGPSSLKENARQLEQINDNIRKLARWAEIDTQFKDAGAPVPNIGALPDVDQSYMSDKRLDGEVPMPVISNDGNIENRVHTQYDWNGYGQKEIVPYMDKTTGKPLVTQYGEGVDIGEHQLSSEYVQERALKLMGLEAKLNPRNTGHNVTNKGGDFHYSDFFVDDGTETGRKIDGMARRDDFDTTAIPMYTAVSPADRYYRSHEDKAMSAKVRRLLSNEIRATGANIEQAVESLIRKGQLGGKTPQHAAGKVLRNDPQRMSPHEVYDELIVTGYDKDDYFQGSKEIDRNPRAPTSVSMVDLDRAREYASGYTDPTNLIITASGGASKGGGPMRTKIQKIFPNDAKVESPTGEGLVFHDATYKHPMVRQLLKGLSY